MLRGCAILHASWMSPVLDVGVIKFLYIVLVLMHRADLGSFCLLMSAIPSKLYKGFIKLCSLDSISKGRLKPGGHLLCEGGRVILLRNLKILLNANLTHPCGGLYQYMYSWSCWGYGRPIIVIYKAHPRGEHKCCRRNSWSPG
jgi:hypothetical protein